MANKDIGKEGKKYQFKKGQSGNPNGRPPKMVSTLLAQLKEEGYERVTAGQVREAYEVMINLDEVKIKDLATDKTQPMFVRIIAKAVLDKKGFDVIERMLDRSQGKVVPIKEDGEAHKIIIEIETK